MKIFCRIFFSLLLLIDVLASPALARESGTIELSLEQAVALAIRHSKALEQTVLEKAYAEETKKGASLAWRPEWATTYVPGTGGDLR